MMTDHEQGFQEWKLYSEHHQKAYDTFDKTLVTVSAGAFIVSISLLHEFEGSICSPGFLYAGWISFGVALLLMLIVMRVGLLSYREQAQISVEYFEDKRTDIERDSNRYIPIINALYLAVMALIGIGLVFLIAFATTNYPMKHSNQSPVNTNTTTWSGQKSAPLTVTVPKATTSAEQSTTGGTSGGNSSSGSTTSQDK